jgi:hypothetical protein
VQLHASISVLLVVAGVYMSRLIKEGNMMKTIAKAIWGREYSKRNILLESRPATHQICWQRKRTTWTLMT